MQFAYNNFISCQATRFFCYLFDFRTKKHRFSHFILGISIVQIMLSRDKHF